jgi:hypothetical protein
MSETSIHNLGTISAIYTLGNISTIDTQRGFYKVYGYPEAGFLTEAALVEYPDGTQEIHINNKEYKIVGDNVQDIQSGT